VYLGTAEPLDDVPHLAYRVEYWCGTVGPLAETATKNSAYAGDKTVTVSVGGTAIKTQTVRIGSVLGDAMATKTAVSMPAKIVAGKTLTFPLKTVDKNGYTVPRTSASAVTFIATVAQAPGSQCTGGGTCAAAGATTPSACAARSTVKHKCTFTAALTDTVIAIDASGAGYIGSSNGLRVSGSYSLALKMNGEDTLVKMSIVVLPDKVHPEHTLASGPGLSGGTAGEKLTFLVALADMYGNNITTEPQGVSLVVGVNAPAKSSCSFDSAGVEAYVCKVKVIQTGLFILDVNVSGVPIHAAPFTGFSVSAAALGEC
jgi:hypothetical protein